MSFRTLLVTKAVVCLAFGIFLLVSPASLVGLLGASLGAGGTFTGREYGAALIGTLVLTWLAKDVVASDARRAILFDLLVYDAIGMVITLSVVVSGVLNALGWSIVAVYGFFVVASAYVLAHERPHQEVSAASGA